MIALGQLALENAGPVASTAANTLGVAVDAGVAVLEMRYFVEIRFGRGPAPSLAFALEMAARLCAKCLVYVEKAAAEAKLAHCCHGNTLPQDPMTE